MDQALVTKELKDFLSGQNTELKAYFQGEIDKQRGTLEEQIKSMGAKFDDTATKNAFENAIKRLDSLEALISNPAAAAKQQSKSIGERVFESEELKSYVGRAKHQGGFAVGFDSLLEQKTTIDSAALGSAVAGVLQPDIIPGIKWGGTRRTRIWDLIPRFPTGNNAVEFVKENTFTNNAYPQTESSAKAESALTFTAASAPVRTVAHGIPASRQALEDMADLRSAIDFRLMTGLADEVDFEVIRGDGTGSHMTGLFTSATAYSSSYDTSADTNIDQLGAAMQQLEDSNRYATGILMRPADWRKINRIKTDVGGANTGYYILGGPGQLNPDMTLWGVPVATSNAVPLGKFLVADFVNGAAIYDRMQARVDVSNEYSDFFMKNLVMIRAELRMALAIFRADCFVYGTFHN